MCAEGAGSSWPAGCALQAAELPCRDSGWLAGRRPGKQGAAALITMSGLWSEILTQQPRGQAEGVHLCAAQMGRRLQSSRLNQFVFLLSWLALECASLRLLLRPAQAVALFDFGLNGQA